MNDVILNVEGSEHTLPYKTHFANLVLLSQSLNAGAQRHYREHGLTAVDVPEIVGITGACENVDTLFRVQSRRKIPLFFSQTGQLSLEQALQSFHGVYTVIHSGRDEEKEDARHLRQFRLTEEEFDCTLADMTKESYNENTMFSALLSHIQRTVQAMIRQILEDHSALLINNYKRTVSFLDEAAHSDFPRITYREAVSYLQKNGYPRLSFGDDLLAEHEAHIVAYKNNNRELPVFITQYPKEIKFFNMKVSESDPAVVLSADLVFPYAGEGTGSAVREHDFARLKKRLITSTMFALHKKRGGTLNDFNWYLKIMKEQKTLPHAGYGIGNERVLQYILGEQDIRNASAFAQLNKQTNDWRD